MKISGWGRYPTIDSNIYMPYNINSLKEYINSIKETIPFGNGRSYGDSALNKNMVSLRRWNYFLNFDEKTGILHCQSGVTISEIIETFLPRGYFLEVTPGTKFITVGGAIASDVHGKNHHKFGCFSESVIEFNLLLPSGEIVNVKRGDELFFATCGGMGLTGIILDAKIKLKKINSAYINQTTIKTRNLAETFDAFEKYGNYEYSVAWIDCLDKKNIGKCLLMVGEFRHDQNFNLKKKKDISVPFDFPSFTLNQYTMRAFNYFYYNKIKEEISYSKVDYETFFYPLDSIKNWNRIYGKNGFIQYQFIIPKKKSYEALEEILFEIAKSNKGSFLAVLKLYGKENKNYLSFPLEGYSLALDFKLEKGIFELLKKLDKIVLKYEGRFYLAKDSTVDRDTFEKGYPLVDKFREVRKKYEFNKKFHSLQSKRLGL